MPFLARILTTLAIGSLMTTACIHAAEVSPKITVGTQEVGLNAGYRFQHISNAGTQYPNLGLNASLPYGGFSFYF